MTSGGTVLKTNASKLQIGNGYLPQLDGLRAVGIALVLIHHGLQPLEFGGFLGVDIFFVLSGFLITGILLREVRRRGSVRFRNFYWRRAIRLYPSLLLAIVVVMPLGFVLRGMKHLAEVVLASTYLTPVVVEVFGNGSQIWLHTWSLGIEEMFYLVWPVALLVLVRKANTKGWIVVGVIGLVMIATQVQLFALTGGTSYFLRAGGLLLGCSLALWLERKPEYSASRVVALAGVAGLAGSVAMGSIHEMQAIAFGVASIGTIAILASITTRRSALASILSSPVAVYIGKISYELYIWHYAILILLRLSTDSRLIDVAWFGIPLSIVLAVGTHHLFSKPIQRWKERVPY